MTSKGASTSIMASIETSNVAASNTMASKEASVSTMAITQTSSVAASTSISKKPASTSTVADIWTQTSNVAATSSTRAVRPTNTPINSCPSNDRVRLPMNAFQYY